MEHGVTPPDPDRSRAIIENILPMTRSFGLDEGLAEGVELDPRLLRPIPAPLCLVLSAVKMQSDVEVLRSDPEIALAPGQEQANHRSIGVGEAKLVSGSLRAFGPI